MVAREGLAAGLRTRRIVAIDPVPTVPTQCIQVGALDERRDLCARRVESVPSAVTTHPSFRHTTIFSRRHELFGVMAT